MAQECCSIDEKDLQKKAVVTQPENAQEKNRSDGDGHDHDQGREDKAGWKSHWDLLFALDILMVLLLLEYGFKIEFSKIPPLIINGIAYLLAG